MVFWSQKADGNMAFTDHWKVLILIFSGMGNTVFFSAKKLMERWYLFTDYWKFLVLNFLVMENTVFFWVKKLMERWYLLVTEKFLFWTFWWWEIRSFFSQKVGGKVIFIWSFWAFHDILRLRKYGFSCSDQPTLKGHVIEITEACIVAFMKARNSLIVWCIEGKKQKMYFFKALAKKVLLTWKSCSWPTFYQMDLTKR